MNHYQVLDKLRSAKTAHIRWRSYAQALINGVPVEGSKVPVIHTDCDFGKWYYGDGQRLSHLSTYQAIEEPHEKLHQLYMKIFSLLFTEEKTSLFQRLIGASAKLTQERKQAAEAAMDEMLAVSRTLIAAIDALERDILSDTTTT